MEQQRELQRQKELELKKEKQKQKSKAVPHKQKEGKECSNCHTINDPSAKFCEECGEPLGNFNCPNCGEEYQPGQDLCEKCGHFLNESSCKFCYAQVEPDDKFCPECGNPTEGIKCHKCGTLSNFDFCPGCRTPLTEAAFAEIEKVKNDPEIKEIAALMEEFKELEEIEVEEEPTLQERMQKRLEEEMAKEKAQREAKFEKLKREFDITKEMFGAPDTPKETNEVSPTPKAPKPKAPKKPIFKERKKRKDLEEIKRKKLEEIQAKLDKLKERTFTDSQSARRFFQATKPVEGNYVWNCNFDDALHPDPNNCGRPDKGGRWVIELGHIEWETHHGEC